MTTVEKSNLKKTSLYDHHVSLNGKIVDFAGWLLPIYYTGIIAEHEWTRKSCSFFDVSHLGELHVAGPGAFDFLQKRLTNDMKKIGDKKILYHLLCDENGFTFDDVLVYREKADDYYVIVNASNIDTDLAEFKKYADASVKIENKSDSIACIAVQGPLAEQVLQKLFGLSLASMEYYTFGEYRIFDQPVWISRSGYTGEDGFEIFSSNELAPSIWDRLVKDGKALGALPAGLGARNTLRLEAGNPLYGHELDRQTTPLEAGLGFAVSLDKGEFVGRAALQAQKEKGLSRRLVAFKVLDKPVARDGYSIFGQGRKIGHVASGSFGPTAGCSIGMGFVEKGFEAPGTGLEIEIHGRKVPAEVVKRPFVALKHKRKV